MQFSYGPAPMNAQVSATPICAALTRSDTCTALGVTVRGPSPALSLCRQLIERGHDPDRPFDAWRGDTLCLRFAR